jgi:hypothetical protein
VNHTNLLARFKSHCHGLKIDLLKDDMTYLSDMLSYYSHDEARLMLKEYLNVWQNAVDEGKKGRYEANVWLRGRVRETTPG